MIGGILQIISWKYLKNHQELLDNQNPKEVEPVTVGIETKRRGLRRFLPRGGAFMEIVGAKIVIYIATNGVVAGLLMTSAGVVITKIPVMAVSKYVRDALPYTHSELKKKNFILVNGEKIYLNQYDRNFEYLVKVLSDQNIPFKEKKELTGSILMEYLDLKTVNGRIRFVLCIVSILHIFSIHDLSNYFIIMKNLIEAIKKGKISKVLARLIIRRLRSEGVEIDPELIMAAS